jgi:geranylgeranyl pyrophosphate synthase
MLVHDDIMDKGTIRRGLPTISVVRSRRARGGGKRSRRIHAAARRQALSRGGLVRHDIVDQLATLVGDVVHAKSLELLTLGAQARPAPVLRVVNAAVRAGAAQFDDVVGWWVVWVSLAEG